MHGLIEGPGDPDSRQILILMANGKWTQMLWCHFATLVSKAEGRDRDREGSRAKPDIGATCRNLTEGRGRAGFHISGLEKMEGARRLPSSEM